jgi:hypothetical protein
VVSEKCLLDLPRSDLYRMCYQSYPTGTAPYYLLTSKEPTECTYALICPSRSCSIVSFRHLIGQYTACIICSININTSSNKRRTVVSMVESNQKPTQGKVTNDKKQGHRNVSSRLPPFSVFHMLNGCKPFNLFINYTPQYLYQPHTRALAHLTQHST